MRAAFGKGFAVMYLGFGMRAGCKKGPLWGFQGPPLWLGCFYAHGMYRDSTSVLFTHPPRDLDWKPLGAGSRLVCLRLPPAPGTVPGRVGIQPELGG